METIYHSIEYKTMKQEIPYLNVARVLAIMMVVSLHCLPNISVYGMDSRFFVVVLLITRPCVPLFLMVTGVLLLPYRSEDITGFYKKRISRVAFPLLFWGIVYSILPYLLGLETVNQILSNLSLVIVTYPKEIGGILWYLYVLIGLYLIIPFVNPKIFEDRKMLHIYLLVWLIASLVSMLKIFYPQILGMGPSSAFDMLLYFSGFLGYLFSGYYVHRYFPTQYTLCKNRLLFFILLAGIYIFCMFVIVFIIKVSIIKESKEIYNVITAFLSLPVIIMAGCAFAGLKEWRVNTDGWLYKIIKQISPLTFGIYLSHMLIHRVFTDRFYQISTSPLIQISVMVTTFIGAYLLTLLLSKIPYSKYIIG